MRKPSKKLLDLTINITGERELEECPKLLGLYTYTLDMEVELARLNNIINELEIELYTKYHEYKDSECEELYTMAQEDKEILDYIKELKVNK